MHLLSKSILSFSLFLVALLICIPELKAQQIKVTVNIPPPYPIHLEDYLQLSDRAIITVSNLSQTSQEVKLITTLSSDNGLSGKVKTAWEPISPLMLSPMETKVLTAPQLRNHFSNLSAADFELSGVSMDQIIRSASLPEGVYSVCVNAYATQTNTLLSDEFGCTRFVLAHYDPPVVLLPAHEDKVPATQPQLVNFTWSPAGIGGITRYSLSLVDMTESGLFNPNDAFGPDNYVQPFFTRDNLTSTVFAYSVSAPPLLAGHTYAVQVTAYDPQGNLAFKNEGRSPVSTFTCQLNVIAVPPNNQQLADAPANQGGGGGLNNNMDLNNQNQAPQFAIQVCQEPPSFQDPVAINGQNVFGVDDVLKLGDHDLLLTQNISWNGKLLSGEGKIKNTWFRIPILVEFEDLEVNAAGIVLSGFAKAKKGANEPVQWTNDLAGVSFGQQEVTNLMNKLLGDDTRVVEWPETKNIGVSMPVGINREIAGEHQMVAIVGMHFGTGGSALNAVTRVKLPAQGDQLILGASGVCFDKNGFTDDAFLFLAEDYTIAPQKAVSLKLLQGDQENPADGTYVNMTKEGYEHLQIDGKIILSSAKVKPVVPNPDGVSASFKVEVDHFKDFILNDVTLPDFELLSLPGFQFGITNLIYDHSEQQNAGGMIWPAIGDPPPGNIWQGLYLESVQVKIPEKLNADTEFVGEHIIFDEDGFTGHLTVDEAFGTNQGKMGSRKWPFSMKDVDIKVEKNVLTSAGFGGKIRVPIQKDDKYLDYTALIATNEDDDLDYQFTITPEGETEFPAIIAKATIDPETHIIVKDDGNGFEPSFHFYGDLTLDTKVGYDVQGADFSFQSIEVNNFVVDKNGFHLGENGSIKYASPVKDFGGFSAGLDNHSFDGGDIGFDFWIKLSEEANVVGGRCGLTIHTNWVNDQIKYESLSVNEVTIKGDVGIATLDGSLAFKHDDPKYGNGFQGKLNIGLQLQAKGNPLEIETNIMFGNKNNLKYFYFDGMVDNLPVGIPITATMRIWGFKGGFYHHMKKVEDTYVPDENIVFGLLAGAAIGLDEKNTFHAKILLEASFTSSGIGEIYFDGNGYMLTEYEAGFEPYDTPTAVHLGVSVHYDFAKKIFDADLEASIAYPYQAPLVQGSGQIHIYADKTKWWIKVGSPSTTPGPDPINVTVLDLYTLKSYFMAGHELGGLPPPPDKVLEILGDAKLENERKSGMLTSGKGLAFGSSVEINPGNLDWWIFYASLEMGAGFDVMLNSGATCNKKPAGINGWYANGSAYAYFDGKVGLYFKFCKKCKERKIPLVDLSVAALIEVGVPNPLWVDGYAAGSASILGIWEGSFDFHVQYGEYCEFTPVYKPKDALSGLVFIQDVLPRENSEDAAAFNVFGQPEVLVTFSTNEDKVYSMPQEDEEANEYDRYFKFPLKELVLSIDDPDSDENGKILARWGENNHDGKFERDYKGDKFLYKSDQILPSHTRLKLEVEVSVKEKINGNWVFQDMKEMGDDTKSKEVVFFKTGKEPEVITDENVEFCYPGRFQRYYLEQDGNYVGYIKTRKSYQDMFDLEYDNALLGTDKIIVRLIPLNGGDALEGEFLKYENSRVFFRHPPLANNQMYAFQLIKEQPPSQWLNNAPDPNQGGGGLQNDFDIANEETLYDLITKKQKLLGALKLAPRQRELYKYVFRTSNFDRLGTKITTAANGQLQKSSTPATISLVDFDIDEPFDEYDRALLIDLKWNPDYKNAHWYNTYLRPHVYQDYQRLLEIAYPGDAQNELTTPVYMQLLGAVPKLTQAEVDAKLAEEMVPDYGVNMVDDLFVLSNGTNSSSASSGSVKHKMVYYGETLGHYTYKYLFMPGLVNGNSPVVLNCFNNWGACNPDLQAIIYYHLVTEKKFKRISAGSYQTHVGYKSGVVNSWNTNDKFGIEWKVPFGISN